MWDKKSKVTRFTLRELIADEVDLDNEIVIYRGEEEDEIVEFWLEDVDRYEPRRRTIIIRVGRDAEWEEAWTERSRLLEKQFTQEHEELVAAARGMIVAVLGITEMYDRKAAGKISVGQVVVITEAKRKLAAALVEVKLRSK